MPLIVNKKDIKRNFSKNDMKKRSNRLVFSQVPHDLTWHIRMDVMKKQLFAFALFFLPIGVAQAETIAVTLPMTMVSEEKAVIKEL